MYQSVSLCINGIIFQQKSVGYDPYAPPEEGELTAANDIEEKAKGLFALARLTGSSSATTPGACRKCGQGE